MKKFARSISLVLLLAFLLTAFGTAASAADAEDSAVITPTGMNELNVRLIISTYFSQRKAFLLGEADDIPTAMDVMVVDEARHRAALSDANALLVESVVEIDSVECWDKIAKTSVSEVLTLRIDGVDVTETIIHDVHVYMFPDGTLEVQRDGYRVSGIGYSSCSYIEPTEGELEVQAATGSKLCIVNIARAEIGYTEEPGTRYTKYSAYYGTVGFDWCACFASWCAAQANIPSTVIRQSPGVNVMSDFFHTNSQFYYKSGSQAPQAGDLIFLYGTDSAPGHVGIIESVDSANVNYIDGNNGGKVASSKISRTSSDFIGFGRPNYQTQNHTYTSTSNAQYHWNQCENCHMTTGKAAHTFNYNTSTKKYVCSGCGYTTSTVPISPSSQDKKENG